jgi:hypothetical protein
MDVICPTAADVGADGIDFLAGFSRSVMRCAFVTVTAESMVSFLPVARVDRVCFT